MNVPKHGQSLQWQGWQDPTKCELLTFHLTRYEVNTIALHCVKLGSLEYSRFHYVKIGNQSLPIFYSIHIYSISDKSNSLVSKYSVNFDVKIWPGNVLYKINIHGCVEVEINVQCFKKNSGSWNILRGKNSLLLLFLSSCVLKQDISKNNNKNDHSLNPNGPKREWCATTHHLFTEGHHIM